jgi:26S proteasome regulatory subunit T4
MTTRAQLIANYISRQKDVATHRERHTRLTNERDDKKKLFERTECQLKNLENIALKVGDVHQKITDDKILVRTSGGARLVVGCRPKIDRDLLKPGVRITMDMSTYTIMGILPREVDHNVHNMQAEDPGKVGFNDVGGLSS